MPIQLAIAEANGEVTKRKPGRPRKVVPPPSYDEIELARAERRHCQAYVDADSLVLEVARSPTTSTQKHGDAVLHELLVELARESANLKFNIQSAQAAVKADDIPRLISRRIDVIGKIASIVLEMRKLGLDHLVTRSRAIQQMHQLFMHIVSEVALVTLPDAESFMFCLARSFEGWEDVLDQSADRRQ